jgi:hypothetical protein
MILFRRKPYTCGENFSVSNRPMSNLVCICIYKIRLDAVTATSLDAANSKKTLIVMFFFIF